MELVKTTVEAGLADITLSVLVVAEGDGRGLDTLLESYRTALDERPDAYEMIVLYDYQGTKIRDILAGIAGDWPNLVDMPVRPWTGDDAAIKIGLGRARADTILTLPGWPEIDPASINDLVAAVGPDDMVIGRRTDKQNSGMQSLRSGLTNGLLRLLFQRHIDDVFCRSRAGRKEVFESIAELGVRQHFMPVIAANEGYRVREIDVASVKGKVPMVYKFKAQGHLGALIDMMTLFVGLKFLKRPLRFFGSIGLPLLVLGLLITAYLVIERLFFGAPLADRPALVFSILMTVLGIQILALGLVGEIIIFSSSRRMRNYEIEKIIRGRLVDPSEAGSSGDQATEPPAENDK
ncbi:glycosyl transferase family 2 [Actibacterium sp. 188UL27-1]|uniref:glycosyl transferase family 2 n=1 Tax=Actibacterium sp. 188UL27-1 TaxID=2786961 RepID=UPI001959B94B|nr:glycosyl transferase family 2 [Actibacterium sp. 188UL27-1]MBM7069086.1 glycosyl transferase family 2 [Actibacterium sp. 188UL27-1]